MRSVVFLCAVIIGIEEWVGMEEFAEEKESWLQSFLPLPKGIKQYDTLSDVMGPNKGYSLYSGLSSCGFAEPIGTADWLGWQAFTGRQNASFYERICRRSAPAREGINPPSQTRHRRQLIALGHAWLPGWRLSV